MNDFLTLADVARNSSAAMRRLDERSARFRQLHAAATQADLVALFQSLSMWAEGIRHRELAKRAAKSAYALSCEKFSRERVYFVQAGRRPIVKIGKAALVPDRARGIQTSCPDELRLIAQFPGGARVEAALHDCLAWYRQRGEWFRISAPVWKLAEMASGSPDTWHEAAK